MKTLPTPRRTPPISEESGRWPFLSAKPRIRLVKAFETPFANVVATARTCYSSKGVIPDEPEVDRSTLAKDLYQAGHHTTFQHAHFQFSMENISRQMIWSFLHSHPFYNSEQVSQRYVEVKPDQAAVPALNDPVSQRIYEETLRMQMEAYHILADKLTPIVQREYAKLFPNRPPEEKKHVQTIKKKAMEIARYVLPVATFAYLYHTVSGITLLRYARLCDQFDAPAEQREAVGQMVEELLTWDPNYRAVLEEAIPFESLPESRRCGQIDGVSRARAKEFIREFDAAMKGTFSTVVDWSAEAEAALAEAVREVLGLPRSALSDGEAIELALSAAENPLLGENLNLTTHSKLTRTLFHPHYTFRKRLSHTADSQDQRHRMTPASRPILAAHFTGEPDFVRPAILDLDPACSDYYEETMRKTWEGINALLERGVKAEFALYLLPNAVRLRFTESSDLLNLRHKHTMRLCYNAQEEIWRASLEEAMQIREIHPAIGKHLLPPCGHRVLSQSRPICPEGIRYCGVPVWKLDLEEYERVL